MRFCELFAAGARRVANCGGAGIRTEVCGTDGGLLGGGVTCGTSGFAVLAVEGALGWLSRAGGTDSCLPVTLSSAFGGLGTVVSAERRNTAAPVGHISVPPACAVPHQVQNFASLSREVAGVTSAAERTDAGVGVTGISIFLAAGMTGSGTTGLSRITGFSTGWGASIGLSVGTVRSIVGDFSAALGCGDFSCRCSGGTTCAGSTSCLTGGCCILASCRFNSSSSR